MIDIRTFCRVCEPACRRAYRGPARDRAARWQGAVVLVRVHGDAGEVELPVKENADLMPGVVAATHRWGHASERPGVNVNRLMPSGPGSFDPLSNMAYMTGIPVDVQLVG